MTPERVAIVGGRGRMGRMFEQAFLQTGHSVLIEDSRDGPIDREAVGGCKVIVLAVPMDQTEDVMSDLGPFTDPEGVVIDIASLKIPSIESMLRHCRGDIIGSHPLFGPSAASFHGRVVFLCPVRSERWFGWYGEFLNRLGARVVEIEPETHDRLMATVQTLRHLLLVSFGRSLMRTGFDIDANRSVAGEWFPLLVDMLQHQLMQDPKLYADLAVTNPHAEPVIEAFDQSVLEIARLVRAKNSEGLVSVMEEVSAHLEGSGAMSQQCAED